MTNPAGMETLGAVLTVPTISPPLVIAASATACVRPTTVGTITSPGRSMAAASRYSRFVAAHPGDAVPTDLFDAS